MRYRLWIVCFLLISTPVCFATDYNPENALWEVFTYTNSVTSIACSDDSHTLWVGTIGGLEQRDAATGKRLRLLTNFDGLPSNWVTSLIDDQNGGIWVGTGNDPLFFGTYGGLAHLDAAGNWRAYDQDNSGLPSNWVTSLLDDKNGGIWIGTGNGGLAHLDAAGNWRAYDQNNSGLPDNYVQSLLDDKNGGIWIGTWGNGLAHLDAAGNWRVYDQDNSGLPDNYVQSLLDDKNGGIWIGTYGGLAHLDADGNWRAYDQYNSGLPDHWVTSLLDDKNGGIWIGTRGSGIAHLDAAGNWHAYDQYNSRLPSNWVTSLLDDKNGNIWIGTVYGGLANLDAAGNWRAYDQNNSGLPDHWVTSLLDDPSNGIWIGTMKGGLANLGADGSWDTYNQNNSALPDNYVQDLLDDKNGGIWIGTRDGGLAHLDTAGNWRVYDQDNSGLPDNRVYSLLDDPSGGIWIGTSGGGLAHLDAAGNWRIYDKDNSGLPSNWVTSLLDDKNGGIWIGTSGGGLAHLDAERNWRTYDQNNSALPSDGVESLLNDLSGGIWVGTSGGGLAHLDAAGNWRTYDQNNSALPSDGVESLLNDLSGGIWIGTSGGGLAHLDADENWSTYSTSNSALPDNSVGSLSPDGNNGLWIGTYAGGLAHVTFGLPDIPQAERAAILIHPTGFNRNDTFSIETMAVYAYNALLKRGFVNEDIYFLSHSPWIDINADGRGDFVVDAPVSLMDFNQGAPQQDDLILADVTQAFEWAKQKGKLDHPLLFAFIGHGLDKRLRLDTMNSALTDAQLKYLLDDYQQTTGNAVIVAIEACYSGTLVPMLSADKRVIVTSANDTQAAYTDMGFGSFSRLFFSELIANHSIYDAFATATEILPEFGPAFKKQKPQLDDDGNGAYDNQDGELARQYHLNGDFATLDGAIPLKPITKARTVTVGDALDLELQIGDSDVGLKEVWALISTPASQQQRNALGYAVTPAPMVWLSSEDNITWRGAFSGFDYRGDYVITFNVKDRNGMVTSSAPVTFPLLNGPEPPGMPVPSQMAYQNGDPLCITIPSASSDTNQYVVMTLPGYDGLLLFTDLNVISIFTGALPPWTGAGDTVLSLPDVTGLPPGTYTVYLLRAPKGVDPLADASQWQLGVATFEME